MIRRGETLSDFSRSVLDELENLREIGYGEGIIEPNSIIQGLIRKRQHFKDEFAVGFNPLKDFSGDKLWAAIGASASAEICISSLATWNTLNKQRIYTPSAIKIACVGPQQELSSAHRGRPQLKAEYNLENDELWVAFRTGVRMDGYYAQPSYIFDITSAIKQAAHAEIVEVPPNNDSVQKP